MCEGVFDIHGADKTMFKEDLICQVPQYQYWVSVDLLSLVVDQDLNEEGKTYLNDLKQHMDGLAPCYSAQKGRKVVADG